MYVYIETVGSHSEGTWIIFITKLILNFREQSTKRLVV
jgi:hypothetical protein